MSLPKFFGQYLLENNIISSGDLLVGIEHQNKTRQKIGEIALAKGYITNEQVKQVHEKQKNTDLRFGDLAIELNLLSKSNLEEILLIQKNSHIYIGEALIAKGFLTNEDLKKHLADFKKSQEDIVKFDFNLPQQYSENDVISYTFELTCKLFERIGDLKVLPAKISILEKNIIENLYIAAGINFDGHMNFTYTLFMNEEACRTVAENDLEEKDLDEDVIQENTGEFANVVCGNIVSYFEKQGKRINISVPKIELASENKDFSLPGNTETVYMPLNTTEGLCGIAISIKKETEEMVSDKKVQPGAKVMIVDDSKTIGIRLKKIIADIPGFEFVGQAFSGKEAVDLFRETKPDLITMDIVLPDISGLEVIRNIRDLEEGKNTPIVVISSLGASQEKVFEAIQSGACNVIVKPFESVKVKQILENSVQSKM